VDGEKCRAHWNDDKEEGAGIKVRIIVYRAKYYQFIVVFFSSVHSRGIRYQAIFIDDIALFYS